MVELIFVRHGETDSNKKGTYLGWTDAELNEDGIKQALSARDKLKGEKVDAIFSSPLKRAGKTAEIINENFNLEIIYSDALKERNFGIWDDLTYKEIMANYHEEYRLWEKDWINYCIKGGESAAQAYARITRFIDNLINDRKEGVFVIVTHLGCIRNMLAYLLGMTIEDTWRFHVDYAKLTRIAINNEGYAYLTALNV